MYFNVTADMYVIIITIIIHSHKTKSCGGKSIPLLLCMEKYVVMQLSVLIKSYG